MKNLRGAKTSKRFYIVIRILIAINVIGAISMGTLAYAQEWNLFAQVAMTCMISTSGLATGYGFTEAMNPHLPNDNTVIIQQGGPNVATTTDELPPNPYVEHG